MKLLDGSAVEMEGPDNFWRGVKYFYSDEPPQVGMVVVRQLLDGEQVESAQEAAATPSIAGIADGTIPNVIATREKIDECLIANGILINNLAMMNNVQWDPTASFGLMKEDYVLTPFGKGVGAHTDVLPLARPVGVSLSISLGKCTFAAGLPPTELRTRMAGSDEQYKNWLQRALLDTPPLQSARLEAGDAALWLQPGVHQSHDVDPDRFACLYITRM